MVVIVVVLVVVKIMMTILMFKRPNDPPSYLVDHENDHVEDCVGDCGDVDVSGSFWHFKRWRFNVLYFMSDMCLRIELTDQNWI